MVEQVVSAEVQEAAMLGIANILVQPEYGDNWIRESVLDGFPEESITDELVEQVDALMTEKLRAMARGILAELSVEKRAGFEFLSE